MSIRMAKQTAGRIEVSQVKVTIMAREINMPMMGVKGTQGVLNGRGSFGSRRRRTHTPAQTMTKASNVPMLTISSRTFMGSDAARTPTNVPTAIEQIHG